MDAGTQALIEAIHHAPGQCVLAVTGGGTTAAAQLLAVPGGSRTVLEVVVPYAEQALLDFLGRAPDQFCSAAASQAMARRARERAAWLAPCAFVAGVGCTASLATDRPKRGDHRFHVTVDTGTSIATYSLTLTKGARDRQGEEAILDAVLLNALAEAFQVARKVPVALLEGERVEVESRPAGGLLTAFLAGGMPALCFGPDGRMQADAPRPVLVLPGSFNPVHRGHWALAETAQRLTGGSAVFELSVTNVDKPPLSPEEVRHRLAAFTWRSPVWLTRAPTFAEKASLFPGAVFVVGADTAVRIVVPRYYQDSDARMTEALNGIRRQGCRFLVAARVEETGRLATLADLGIPEPFRDLFAGIDAEQFRVDLSSTQLRAEGGGMKNET